MKDLPKKHQKVLNYLANFAKTKGRLPNNVEIAFGTGLKVSDVGQILNILKRKGYIKAR
jgi:DNA-binding MarR family transcriptional regulator